MIFLKILIVNPPVYRHNHESPEGDNYLKSGLIKFRLEHSQLGKILNLAGIGTELRYGYRAGCRWPYTISYPDVAINYPISMGYPASYLKHHGHAVAIIDAVAEQNYSYDKFIQQVKDVVPDIVIIECSSPTIDIDIWMAKEISKFSEVALAGTHLTSSAEQIHVEYPFIRYLLKGEYIRSSLEMVTTRRAGIYESDIVANMDAIPYPDRSFNKATEYYEPSVPSQKPQLQITSSKGCPFKCIYCSWVQTMYNGLVSYRNPKSVAAEIKYCIKHHGYKSIMFDDDTFNIGNERVSELCDELHKIGLPWSMMGRLDTSPRWLFDKMIQCGCTGMRFGIESMDDEVLLKIKKGLTRYVILKTLDYLISKHPDLVIHVMLMKELPGQSKSSHEDDITQLSNMGFITKHGHRSYQVSSFASFPGTASYHTETKTIKSIDGGRNA